MAATPAPARNPEAQLARVLALLPWITAHPGTPKADVARRFGITVAQLEQDLDLAMMIGVPPYSPGDYVTVDSDGDDVTVWLAPLFERPLRLTPSEGVALLAAGRTLLAVPGSDPDGPLARALDKLEERLGDVQVDVGGAEHLDAVRRAAEDGRTLEIDYWSGARGEMTTRRIDPQPPFFALGAWYTDAFCRLRRAPRMFRVDRIRELRATDERFSPEEPTSSSGVFDAGPAVPRAEVVVPAAARWIADNHPVDFVEDAGDGRLRIGLAVAEPAWLARQLLRVGSEARVETPADAQGVTAALAARIRDRYTRGRAQ